jgi:hypothetical protein
MTITKVHIGDSEELLPEVQTPFLPVYAAFRDVMIHKDGPPVTLEHVIEAVVSLALTAAINMRLQFKDDPNCPSVEGLSRVLCFHIMVGARDAERELSQHMGDGATRQ